MRYIFILFLLSNQLLSAQEHDADIFGSLPFNDSIDYSYMADMKCIGDYYYFLVSYRYQDEEMYSDALHKSIIKTDSDFNVINRLDSETQVGVGDYGPNSFIYTSEANNYALLSSIDEGNDRYIISYINLNTFEIFKTDSVQLPLDHKLSLNHFKHIKDTVLVSMGQLYTKESSEYIYMFIEISPMGKILRFENLSPSGVRILRGFEYLREEELYFVSIPKENYRVYDEDLNLVQLVNDKFNAEEIKFYNLSLDDRFIEAKDGFIHCVGRIDFLGLQYSLTHLRLPIIGDSIGEIDQVDPLLEVSREFVPEWAIPSVDKHGNLFVVLDDQFSMPQQSGIDTTTLYIIKTNLNDYGYRTNEWFLAFSNGTEMSAWAGDTDKNGNFIIVGGYNSEEIYDEVRVFRNFYLKVLGDGTISSTKGPMPDNLMVVYPNPTSGPVNVKAEPGDYAEYVVYDMQGRLLKSGKAGGSMDFDISEFHAGTYFIHFKDSAGKVIGNSKVVKY